MHKLSLHNFKRHPVLKLYCHQYHQLLQLKKKLRQINMNVYETDIRPPNRYLIKRFITANVLFDNIEQPDGSLLCKSLKPAPNYHPTLHLISLDIETNAHGKLYSITLNDYGQRQIYMLNPTNDNANILNFDLKYYNSHKALLEHLND